MQIMQEKHLSTVVETHDAKQQSEDMLLQQFSVPYEYPVYFSDKLFDLKNPVLINTPARLEPEKCHRVVVFVDDGLLESRKNLPQEIEAYANHHSKSVKLTTAPIAMPSGEKIKSELHFIERTQKVVADHHIDRHSYVIGIGGGALLDAVGLVAATSHRGIRHIRVPTTVLAQNDSGVGVKNSVNLYGQKNYISVL